MSSMRGIRRFFRIDRDGAGVDRAVDDELRFHFDMTMRDLMSSGMNSDDARREAERRFGDVGAARERMATIDRSRVDRERRAAWWSGFAQDLRYAVRGLRLKPGFAIAVIVTLGLGIGANAAMFGIVDRLLFRPPNFLIAPDRAARLYLAKTFRGKEGINSYAGFRPYLDWRENTTSFDAMTPFAANEVAIGAGSATREMNVGESGADLWKMFDVKPVIGRFFTEAENLPPRGSNVVVLSYAFWQTEFGGRNDVLGTLIDIGPAKYNVIGVAPKGFNAFASRPLIAFVPIAATTAANNMGDPKDPWYSTYHMSWFEVFARRRPNVSLDAATADLTHAVQLSYKAELEKDPHQTPIELVKPHAIVGPLLRDRGPNEGNDAKVATWLVGVAAAVLLIACANVANLLLARALKRRREIAVRIALGVSRGRLLMQLMIESLLLAILGGVLGIVIAQWGGAVMRTALLGDDHAPGIFADRRVLLFSALLAAIAGVLTGLAPALQAGRADIAATLKSGAREGTVHRSRIRIGLLVLQAALSVVLLVGAGLFIRSLTNVQQLRLGYDVDQVLMVNLNDRGVTLDSSQKVALRQQLLTRVATVPGVEHASRALTVPFWMTWQLGISVDGIDSTNALGNFSLQTGTPDYFATTGTRIVRGRGITADDRANAPLTMVVGESMGRKLWPHDDPIGKCVRIGDNSVPCRRVVGIAEDVRGQSLTEPDLHYYLPTDQFHPTEGGLFVRTVGVAADQVERVRRALQPIMPGVSYVTVTPMSTIIGGETRSWKLGATMFAVFGALALVLAAIGLYSVIAYNVTQRTHEMGVRVALGAQSNDVIALVVREGFTVVVPGIALGTLISLVAGKWIAPLLFQVSPNDPPVLIGVVATLLIVAMAASWVPALRASRVNPNEALRSD